LNNFKLVKCENSIFNLNYLFFLPLCYPLDSAVKGGQNTYPPAATALYLTSFAGKADTGVQGTEARNAGTSTSNDSQMGHKTIRCPREKHLKRGKQNGNREVIHTSSHVAYLRIPYKMGWPESTNCYSWPP